MYPRAQLRRTLERIEGRPYSAYRDLTGAYDYGEYVLHVDHVQPDPFAPATRLRVEMRQPPLPAWALETALARLATEDWLLRRLTAGLARVAEGPDGPSPAAALHVLTPGQQVLERSALRVGVRGLEVRLTCQLPAEQRQVRAARAAAALDVTLPAAIRGMLPVGQADEAGLRSHLNLLEDQRALRGLLGARGWVAFLADDAILPRASGASDLPLPGPAAVPLRAPEALAATVELPHRGAVRGMAIPAGVTLLVGGAYHGKSTLLRAIERGVYDHVSGDGRELCCTRQDAVLVAAEDGRAVTGVDISAFVGRLPGGQGTTPFRTLAASGSTSQAAAVAEAIEQGSRLLLIDEDRSAANFIARDERMRDLVPDADDPVVPFADRVRWLWERAGVSTIMVVGGAGALLAAADRVLRMRDFQPEDVTAEAAAVIRAHPRVPAAAPPPEHLPSERVPGADALAAVGPQPLRARPRGTGLQVGQALVDLRPSGAIVEAGQLSALADMVARCARYADGRRTLAEVVREVEADVDRMGLDVLSPWAGQVPGEYARPRAMELAQALNRVPGLLLAGDPVPPTRGDRVRRTPGLRPTARAQRPAARATRPNRRLAGPVVRPAAAVRPPAKNVPAAPQRQRGRPLRPDAQGLSALRPKGDARGRDSKRK